MKRQNPIARLLSNPKFKSQTMADKTKYNRKKVNEKTDYNGMMRDGLLKIQNTKG
jgi:hypothetical protein